MWSDVHLWSESITFRYVFNADVQSSAVEKKMFKLNNKNN